MWAMRKGEHSTLKQHEGRGGKQSVLDRAAGWRGLLNRHGDNLAERSACASFSTNPSVSWLVSSTGWMRK